jgi:hypothetical protein
MNSLLACEVLERVNNYSSVVVFGNAVNLLWPDKVERENVPLFVSDAAPYMIKTAKVLRLLYPKMIHVTCLTHALHRVAEEVCGSYPEVDKLIAKGKKTFIKSPLQVQKFKEEAPTLPLPPQPTVTHWGTWLDAANYYCTNYSQIEIFSKFNRKKFIFNQMCTGAVFSHNVKKCSLHKSKLLWDIEVHHLP